MSSCTLQASNVPYTNPEFVNSITSYASHQRENPKPSQESTERHKTDKISPESHEVFVKIPPNCHIPSSIRPTILKIRKHWNTEQIVKNTNDYFIKNWPLESKKQEKFINQGFAFCVCIACPMSLDERLYLGCRLLTLAVLIDDLLDHMSNEEGSKYNNGLIDCIKGKSPNETSPQIIIHDIFNEMEKMDRTLTNDLKSLMIDFLMAQTNTQRKNIMNLKDYLEFRYFDFGKGLLSGVMRFCSGLHMTSEELEVLRPIEQNALKHATFINDAISYDKEIIASRFGELGSVFSSVPIMKSIFELNDEETKHIMIEMARSYEKKHFDMVSDILKQHSTVSMIKYLKGLEYQISGLEYWTLLTPRYRLTS